MASGSNLATRTLMSSTLNPLLLRFTAGFSALFFASTAFSVEYSLSEIQNQVTSHLAATYEARHDMPVSTGGQIDTAAAHRGPRVSIETASLDPRLTMPSCNKQLAVELNGNRAIPAYGRVSVKVSCQGERPWAKYLSATIRLFDEVVTLRHAVTRGEVLSADDLLLRELDISQERREPIRDPQLALGKTVKQSLQSGGVLSEELLLDPVIVSRGDLVEIVARSGGITISQRGIALQSGTEGAAIDIKNSSSDVTVQAQIVAPGKVFIQL